MSGLPWARSHRCAAPAPITMAPTHVAAAFASPQDDPFLLIESIPARETRHYIKNVISNLALYRMQLGEPAPELRELAAGGQGRFVSLFVPPMVNSDDGS